MSVGENIKKMRKSAGMTQHELAKAINKSCSVVQKYELGITMPPLPIVFDIAAVLGCSWDDIVNGKILTGHEAEAAIEDANRENKRLADSVSDMLESGDKNIKPLIKSYEELNSIGKNEAVKRITELTEIPRYTTPDEE